MDSLAEEPGKVDVGSAVVEYRVAERGRRWQIGTGFPFLASGDGAVLFVMLTLSEWCTAEDIGSRLAAADSGLNSEERSAVLVDFSSCMARLEARGLVKSRRRE